MKRFSFYLVIVGITFVTGIAGFYFFNLGYFSTRTDITLPVINTGKASVSGEPKDALIVMDVFEFARKPSRPLKDIQWISIVNAEEIGYGCANSNDSPCSVDISNLPRWEMELPHGVLMTDRKLYNWTAEKLSTEDVSFTTETKEGINYEFSGRFLLSGSFEDIKPQGVVLKGRLRKMKDNRVFAEEVIEFFWRSREDVDHETMKLKPKSK